MIRVLHVFNMFAQGGIENFVMNVFRNIDRDKFQFDFAFIKSEKGIFDDEAKALGAHLYYFDSEEKSLSNYKKSLTRIIKEHGPYDVVHSHCYFFSGYILKIAKKCGVPIRIAHSHDTAKGQKQTVLRKLYQSFMRAQIKKNATAMIGCSDLAARYVFGEKAGYRVIYNGIDVERFKFNPIKRDEIRRELGINDDSLAVINVGRFADQKNHDFIIDIFDALLKRTDKCRLILIGDGPLKPQIMSKAEGLGLSDKISFVFNTFNPEYYYSAADVFILPSHYEGMPIVSVEAQTAGLPSILSDKITDEVNITDLYERLSIDNGADIWVEEICRRKIEEDSRRERYLDIRNTPFDISNTVKSLCDCYEGRVE